MIKLRDEHAAIVLALPVRREQIDKEFQEALKSYSDGVTALAQMLADIYADGENEMTLSIQNDGVYLVSKKDTNEKPEPKE